MPEKMGDFFDARATGYEDHMRKNIEDFTEFYHTAVSGINSGKDKIRILDLGVGTGLELDNLITKLPNAEFTLIDISKAMLDKLAVKFTSYQDSLKLLNISYLDYDFPIAHFDYVITVQSLHHLMFKEKVGLYKNIAKSLKKNGEFIEADFIVSKKLEYEYLLHYYSVTSNLETIKPAEYHLDIPFSWQTTKRALDRAGLKVKNIFFESRYAVIYSAQKK